jgi:uncharacterized UPF0160 family protein
MIIATHSGRFHADDVWAVAALNLIFPGCELIRTRDATLIAQANFVVDVGGVWDAPTGRFDHHQKGFIGARDSGVVYASAGLVWKSFGPRCVEIVAQQRVGHEISPEQARQIASAIDYDLVQYLDMSDTGTARNAPGSYGLSAVISGFNPTWMEEQKAGTAEAAEALRLAQFKRAMAFVEEILINAVKYRVGAMLAAAQVRQSTLIEDGQVLFLKNGSLPWSSLVRHEMPTVLFVLSHSVAEDRYMLHTVPTAPDNFIARKDLPAAWAGLQGEELAAVTGVPDAMFCHNKRFIAAARSYEGALQMVRLALAEPTAQTAPP